MPGGRSYISKKSWLSREILVAGLFGVVWAVAVGLRFFWGISPNLWPLAILGLGLIYCMSQRLPP